MYSSIWSIYLLLSIIDVTKMWVMGWGGEGSIINKDRQWCQNATDDKPDLFWYYYSRKSLLLPNSSPLHHPPFLYKHSLKINIYERGTAIFTVQPSKYSQSLVIYMDNNLSELQSPIFLVSSRSASQNFSVIAPLPRNGCVPILNGRI